MAITEATDSMKQVRDYWDSYLEYNPLRTGSKDTDAGAFLAHQIQAAGDVLRELAKDIPDPAYMKEKTQRIRRSLPWKRDWTDSLSLGEQQRLRQTKELLQGLPAPTREAEILKYLLSVITDRNTTAIAKSLDELEPLLFGSTNHNNPNIVTKAPPHILSMENYRENWQPKGWKLIIIGPTSTWRQEWGEWEAIRDIVQNALDEAEAYRWGYDDQGLWISDRGKGVAVADFLLGPPKLKPDYARGKFGEGMKIASLALIRKGWPVYVETVGRELWIIFLEQDVDGTAETLAAMWRSNGRMQGTEFHIVGYTGSAFEDRFAVNLPRSSIIAEAPSPLAEPVRRYNQLIDHAFPTGSRIYGRDIYMRDINSLYSYNLWGFEMAPDRFGPKNESDMYADMGRIWSCVDKVNLLEIFLQMIMDPPVIETAESYFINLSEFQTGIEPVSGKKYQEFVRDNASAWRMAWHKQLGENIVLRTDPRWDSMVKHLGYESASVQHGVEYCLRQVIITDNDIIKASQDRLREVEVISDKSLTGRQLACLELARGISTRLTQWTAEPVRGVHAAIIPPASDRVRTAGMYGRSTVEIYISADHLQHGRSTVDTVIHELAHHTTGAEDGEEDHNAEMTRLASLVVEATAKGYFDSLIGAPDFAW